MKKYTVKDNLGNKKTVYANDLSHALTFVDSKVKDVRVEKGDWFTLRQRSDVLYKVIDDQNKSYNGFTEAMIVEKYKIDFADLRKSHEIKIIKVGNESFHPERLSTEIIRFNSSKEAIDWFKRQKELRSRKYDSIKDEANLPTTIQALVNDEEAAIKLNDDSDYLGLVKINGRTWYVRHQKSVVGPEWWGITPSKWGDNPRKKFKSKAELDKYLESVGAFSDSKTRDEASLATTINALINDEKAAIDAYNVAIKNLEGSIDDTSKQVLINIMKDERRHVENLYAVLNGQVTEKNLKDSIHDAVKSPSAYVNTSFVKNMLPNDLMAEGLKNDYSFNDVLKNFDAISSKILDVVKDALDEAKRDIIDFKRNYINALIN